MDSSSEEVGSPENTILALLDYLVDPLLPSKSSSSSSREILSPSQEELVAKQVHAVVVLYNYYHRQRHLGLEFLDFESFCKITIALKPSLLSYLKLMQKEDYTKVDNLDKQLSLTEKAIINGCDLCKRLDASKNQPVIEGWPITKIAVFLVDSKKENCYLFHGSITRGVWSIIEKDVDDSNQSSEVVTAARTRNKKTRVAKRAQKENRTADEASLQHLAWLAVKEAYGINQDDLRTLEKHVVYSVGKEKTAVNLYIMQCTQTNVATNLVPINDAIESLQGPLVIQETGNWITTPVVEYFHLLPFADKVSDWLSREGLLNTLQDFEVPKADGNSSSSNKVEPLPRTSECFEVVKQVTNDENSHLEVRPLPNTINHFEIVKELENHSSQLTVEPRLNALQNGETAREIRKQNNPHILMKPLLNTLNQIETVKQVENCKSSHIKVGPPLNYSAHIIKEVEDCTNSNLGVEPLPNILNHIEAVNENYNSSQLREEKLRDTLQPSTAVTEARNGDCYPLKEGFLQHSSQHSESAEVKYNNSSEKKPVRTETVVYKKRNKSKMNCNSKNPGRKTSNTTTQSPKQDDRKCAVAGSSANMGIDESLTNCSRVDDKSKTLFHGGQVDNQKQIILAEETDQIALTEGAAIVADLIDNLPSSDEQSVEKLTIASKKTLLSQSSLKVLFRKREILSQQHRSIADDLASCDRSIQTIISGGEENLAVKIDSVIEGCNGICLRSVTTAEATTCQHVSNQELSPVAKRKKLSEAILFVHRPCQELDDICNENGWILPIYHVYVSEGGFQANVTVKGIDFECSSMGDICDSPLEARNSSASRLLVKLRSMADKS